MDESDLHAEEALARLGVDQLSPLLGEADQLGLDVVDLVGDVVHARPALGEELADRRVVAKRRQQLDPAAADEHRSCLDALILNRGTVLELGAEQQLVGLEGLIQVVHSNAEMMDAAWDHAADANGALFAGGGDRANRAHGLGSP